MNNQERLLSMLPGFFAELRQMKEIAKAEGEQFDKLDYNIDDVLNQSFILTATWGLSEWEKRYKLPVLDKSDNYELRRKRILAAKRSSKADLIDILKSVEPTIEMSWGGLIIPLYLISEEDYYNFAELIGVLEVEKPSHLGYQFTINPNGYTVRANRLDRKKVGLNLISGSAKSGRYPWLSTQGTASKGNVCLSPSKRTGLATLQKAAGLVSGAKNKNTSFGTVDKEIITIRPLLVSGESNLEISGTKSSGQLTHETTGSKQSKVINLTSNAKTGNANIFHCGVRVSGEGVA